MNETDERRNSAGNGRLDPTRMVNQPALQRSRGTIWIVMGGLFLVAALIPFGALIFGGTGSSAGLALTAAALMVLLYAALVVMRFAVAQQQLRTRLMAVCMLTMAAVALLGVILCAMIENASAG